MAEARGVVSQQKQGRLSKLFQAVHRILCMVYQKQTTPTNHENKLGLHKIRDIFYNRPKCVFFIIYGISVLVTIEVII